MFLEDDKVLSPLCSRLFLKHFFNLLLIFLLTAVSLLTSPYPKVFMYNILITFTLHNIGGSDCKESACSAGDLGSIPGLGRPTGEENGYPLQYSWLENPMDRGA